MDPEIRAVPSLAGTRLAHERIVPYGVTGTPFRPSPGLSLLVGTEVWVKYENQQPTGAFKVRGGINLVSQLGEEERAAGVIAASTGNHGQSVAHAAQLFGVRATICVPQEANPTKVRAMRDLGAEVVFHGADFDDAREHAAAQAELHGYRYIHSGNEPHLIEGVGTHTLEILEAEPDVDAVIVPIGGGSGAAGACIAGKGIKPSVRIIGVQAAAAPAAYRSWKDRAVVEDQMQTAAEGLATRVGFELPQEILWEHLDDFVLIDEDEIRRATSLMIEHTRALVEAAGASPLGAAGASPLGAALKLKDQLRGSKVALICSGGNITMDQLKALLLST